ncbi:MAG: hypothetical protein JWO31_2231, partial [Phycisphaerales bacterium]|nr:hypothetical protein [Phycisphaerales bacterium]
WGAAAGGTFTLAVVLVAAWWAVDQYADQIATFNVLLLGRYITLVAVGGLVLAIVGGFIEHRRMREETHVMAALFANALAAVGGGMLWLLYAIQSGALAGVKIL